MGVAYTAVLIVQRHVQRVLTKYDTADSGKVRTVADVRVCGCGTCVSRRVNSHYGEK